MAIAAPMVCPAKTSLQWLRYSATLLMPVNTARLTRDRLTKGPVRRPLLEPVQHMMYI